ncbi:hypothetical protein [Corynebacterium uterequi]|nr:hypothetical protein [Corynebacterium uterequi]
MVAISAFSAVLWREQTPVLLAIFGACVVLAIACGIASRKRGVRASTRQPVRPDPALNFGSVIPLIAAYAVWWLAPLWPATWWAGLAWAALGGGACYLLSRKAYRG